MGVSAQHRDVRLAPTGVSVILASYEPHNKRQEMSILMHPVLDKSGKSVKFLSTFRQEIGPCVGKGDDVAMLYPPAAIYGTNMDYLIIAQILAVRRHAYNNGPMPYFVVEELNRHVTYMRFNDEWKFFHIMPKTMLEEILASTILLQEYQGTNRYRWDNDLSHPLLVPVHEMTHDGRVWLKNKHEESGMQLCDMRKVDAEAVRCMLHLPTFNTPLEKMTLITPHDLAIISLKGSHHSSHAGHLGDSEKRVARRVNFPRRMDTVDRNLVLLKAMMLRFEAMNQGAPQEYLDELLKATTLEGKEVRCEQEGCMMDKCVNCCPLCG